MRSSPDLIHGGEDGLKIACEFCLYFISGDLYCGTKNVLFQGVDVSSFHVDLNVNICKMNGARNRCVSNRRVFMYFECMLQ